MSTLGWQPSASLFTCSIAATLPCTISTRSEAFTTPVYPREVLHSLSTLIYNSSDFRLKISPKNSLVEGKWVKLICGASFEDVADVRNLSMVYTIAGVDCIDCAADPSVVRAVREGINAAIHVVKAIGNNVTLKRPWVMVSINDDEDLHFRKAEFDPTNCPSNCPRPCERICPASAIRFNDVPAEPFDKEGNYQKQPFLGGVVTERCYGCGRCIPVCPLGLIDAKSYVRSFESVSELLKMGDVDAIEIHTTARHLESFKRLWESLESSMQSLKLIAVSLPDLGDDMLATMWILYRIMKPSLKALNLWQMDGRPMSGDIGVGATKAAVSLAAKVAAYPNRPPGFLQLAGGTNAHTVDALYNCGLYHHGGRNLHIFEEIRLKHVEHAAISGIAYGGYARKIVSQVLKKMGHKENPKLESYPLLLLESLEKAMALVGPSKGLL